MCESELSRLDRPLQRGFSLVEMLVAMVILSLSLGVLYQAAAGAIRNARVSGEYTEAVILAESKLAEYGYVTVESFSVQDRLGSFFWSVQSWPVPPLAWNIRTRRQSPSSWQAISGISDMTLSPR